MVKPSHFKIFCKHDLDIYLTETVLERSEPSLRRLRQTVPTRSTAEAVEVQHDVPALAHDLALLL